MDSRLKFQVAESRKSGEGGDDPELLLHKEQIKIEEISGNLLVRILA